MSCQKKNTILSEGIGLSVVSFLNSLVIGMAFTKLPFKSI